MGVSKCLGHGPHPWLRPCEQNLSPATQRLRPSGVRRRPTLRGLWGSGRGLPLTANENMPVCRATRPGSEASSVFPAHCTLGGEAHPTLGMCQRELPQPDRAGLREEGKAAWVAPGRLSKLLVYPYLWPSPRVPGQHGRSTLGLQPLTVGMGQRKRGTVACSPADPSSILQPWPLSRCP